MRRDVQETMCLYIRLACLSKSHPSFYEKIWVSSQVGCVGQGVPDKSILLKSKWAAVGCLQGRGSIQSFSHNQSSPRDAMGKISLNGLVELSVKINLFLVVIRESWIYTAVSGLEKVEMIRTFCVPSQASSSGSRYCKSTNHAVFAPRLLAISHLLLPSLLKSYFFFSWLVQGKGIPSVLAKEQVTLPKWMNFRESSKGVGRVIFNPKILFQILDL